MESVALILVGVAIAIACFLIIQNFWSFKAQSPKDYASATEQFDIRQHLNGPIECEGVIYGPTGRVTSRFVAQMNATWDGNTGEMTEDFRYDSGETQQRRWTLTIGNDGRIRAEAPDLIGTGRGAQMGSGVSLNYRIKLPEGAGGHVLEVTDWMYLVENGTIINRSQFRKYGIKVAELVATMRKKPVERLYV